MRRSTRHSSPCFSFRRSVEYADVPDVKRGVGVDARVRFLSSVAGTAWWLAERFRNICAVVQSFLRAVALHFSSSMRAV
jgi:hypothetical protein